MVIVMESVVKESGDRLEVPETGLRPVFEQATNLWQLLATSGSPCIPPDPRLGQECIDIDTGMDSSKGF
jgi:hypothetical protein